MIQRTLFQIAPVGGNVEKLMKAGSFVKSWVKLSKPTH